MDSLGRYYTKDFVSNLLIDNLKATSPKKILDLGIGNASLTLAAFTRWKNAQFYATEIESYKVNEIKSNFSFVNIFNHDSLKPNLPTILKTKIASIDVAICNPPYVRIINKNEYSKLFKDADCETFNSLKKITSEIVFFAQNLALLKNKGELGIILSDSLVCGKDFRIFREVILKNFDLRSIIQLPDNIFKKTEARTYILILSKSKTVSMFCDLYQSDVLGNLSGKMTISKDDLIERMDYKFFKFKQNNRSTLVTLKNIGAIIKRGNLTYCELKKSNISYFHSIHFGINNRELKFKKNIYFDRNIAKAGDILLCRVGKRCVGKSAYIKSGNIRISDCIFRITVPKNFRMAVWKSLNSKQGIEWLDGYAHGVCSQVISKSDLENFPIYCL